MKLNEEFPLTKKLAAKNMIAIQSGQFSYRVLEDIDVFIHMSKKELSILSFPDVEGKYDYLCFDSKDSSSIKWCKDTFNYYGSEPGITL